MRKLLQLFLILGLYLSSFNCFAQDWNEIASLPISGNDIHFVDQHTGYIVGNGGICYKSTDGGTIWNEINTGTDVNLYRISFLDQTTGYIAGAAGTILKTTNNGEDWIPLNTGVTIGINLIQAVSDEIIFAAGAWDSAYLKSSDAGISWTHIPFQDKVQTFSFLSESVGYIGGGGEDPELEWTSYANLYKTNDGGITWEKKYSDIIQEMGPPIDGIHSVSFINNNIGYIRQSGYYNTIFKTIDSGETWEIFSGPAEMVSGVISFQADDMGWEYGSAMGTPYITRHLGEDTYGTVLEEHVTAASFLEAPNYVGWLLIHNGVYRFESLPCEGLSFFSNVTPNSSNPNNIFIPGSAIRFKTKVKNNLPDNLMTLSGTITTTSPYVTITNNVGTYNNIVSGESGWTANEYEIILSDDIPNNTVINFDLLLEDEILTTDPWLTTFSMPVVLNPFDVSNNIIDDDAIPDSDGNNNDIAEPGETIEIIPLINNTSIHSFSNIEGYLFSPFPEINVWNNVQGATEIVYNHYPYGNIEVGANNLMPEKDFVFTNNFTEIYNLPFEMIMTGHLSSFDGSTRFNDIEFRWAASFIMNDGNPNPPTSISDISKNSINIYPNPSDGQINISGIKNLKQIKVLDAQGKLVWNSMISMSEVINIDLSENAPGTYIIELITETGNIQKKITLK